MDVVVSCFATSTTAAHDDPTQIKGGNGNHGNNNSNHNHNMIQFKERLAKGALKQVAKHGWTQAAITAAAVEDTKLSISMSGMLSPTELLHWFMDDMNRQLRLRRNERMNDTTASSATASSVFDAVQWRLQQVIPLVESGQWHKGMAMGLSTPLTTRAQLHEFIEIVSPPDSSIEYQTALGAIFVATELHLLTDSSTNYQDTWSFLERRLDELEKHKDNPSLLLASISPLSSMLSNNKIDSTIPLVAGMAVASSLVEGVMSLVMPNSVTNAVRGTKPSDYNSPSHNR